MVWVLGLPLGRSGQSTSLESDGSWRLRHDDGQTGRPKSKKQGG